MLETSFILLLSHVLLYIFLPSVAGILFIFLFFWTKIKGLELLIVSWFFWIAAISYFMYNIQFFRFGIGVHEYLLLLFILFFACLIRGVRLKENIWEYVRCLKIQFSIWFLLKQSFNLPKCQQYISAFFLFYISMFLLVWFLYNTSFPTYFDDTFWNWNLAAINIFFDGGLLIFWEQTEILWYGWRINYPIYISIFKWVVWNFAWGWYDSYQNLFQYFSFLFFIIFVLHISYIRTKNFFFALLPAFIVCWMSLIFFHIIDGYMDITCWIYSVFTIYYLYKFLQKTDIVYFFLAALFGILLMNIKNDAFVVYLPWIIIALFVYLFITKDIKRYLGILFNKKNIIPSSFLFLFFFLPPVFVRFYHGFALNPQANDGFESKSLFHPEVFWVMDDIFLKADNYNVILLFVAIIFLYQKKNDTRFILFAFLAIFCIFCLVFLFTSNYRWVLDQTTVNRVFLSSFIILFSFTSFFLKDDIKTA
jgi:hypothetical protein